MQTALAAIPAIQAATALLNRAEALRAAEVAAMVAPRRNTYPILANVRLRGDGNTLFITATDLDIMVDVAVPAAADGALDVTVPAQLFRDLLKNAPKVADVVSIATPEPVRKTRNRTETVTDTEESGEDYTVMVTEDYFEAEPNLTVDFDAAKYHVLGLESAAFPDLRGPVATDSEGAPMPDYRGFAMPAADLYAAMNSVKFAMSAEETRYYLNGICLHSTTPHGKNRPELRFVATDGHRLARAEVTAPEGATDMGSIIIPSATIMLLLKLLKPAKGVDLGTVTVEVGTRTIRMMFGNITVTSKLIDGSFPDYERVTPAGNDRLATFNADALMASIKATALITDGNAVKLTFDSAAGKLEVSCFSPDHGTAISEIEFEPDHMPERFEIGFNAKYLAGIVSEARADGADVTMAFSDAGGPALITGTERNDWTGVLMPMRV